MSNPPQPTTNNDPSEEVPIVITPYTHVIEADIYNASGKRIFENIHICVIRERSENPMLILPPNRAFVSQLSTEELQRIRTLGTMNQ